MPTNKFADSTPGFGALLGESFRLLSRNFNARVRDYGLTQTQWQALAVLAKREGMKQAELAELLQVQPISIARLIDRMEAAGWVERRADPRDRRALQLFLTPKVEPVVDAMFDAGVATREQAMAGMNNSEREQLFNLLSRVTNNLRNVESTETGSTIASGNENDAPQPRAQSRHQSRPQARRRSG